MQAHNPVAAGFAKILFVGFAGFGKADLYTVI